MGPIGDHDIGATGNILLRLLRLPGVGDAIEQAIKDQHGSSTHDRLVIDLRGATGGPILAV